MAEKEKPKKKSSQKWNAFKDGKKINRDCPKCGPGIYLAKHSNRLTCGRCGYFESKS